MDRIEIKWNINQGLGTFLGSLSLLYHTNKRVRWLVEESNAHIAHNNFKSTIQTFNLDPDLIEFKFVKTGDFIPEKIGDTVKIFSPYIKFAGMKNNRKKPFILIPMYGTCLPLNPRIDDKEQPFVKFQKDYVYSHVINLCLSLGYDVVTLDKLSMSVKEKILFMINYCEAVIGYEGGLAHLAHALDIPCIILPHKKPMNTTILHMHEKAYHITDVNEIMEMKIPGLLYILEKCKENRGNNVVFSDNYESFVTPTYDYLLFKSKLNTQNSFLWHNVWLTEGDRKFINDHGNPTHIGGIKEFVIAGDSRKRPIFPDLENNDLYTNSVGGPTSVINYESNRRIYEHGQQVDPAEVSAKLPKFEETIKNNIVSTSNSAVKFKKWKLKKPKL
jgi:hypothetical protein